MRVKMVLGTVVVAEDALDVASASLAVLTVSLLLKDTKQCLLIGTIYVWALLVSPRHFGKQLLFFNLHKPLVSHQTCPSWNVILLLQLHCYAPVMPMCLGAQAVGFLSVLKEKLKYPNTQRKPNFFGKACRFLILWGLTCNKKNWNKKSKQTQQKIPPRETEKKPQNKTN